MPRCPGQNQQYWTAEDIFDVKCPSCGKDIEFWKDEPMRFCASCGKEVRNPRIDLGCAKWCKHAEECLGKLPGALPATPLLEIFKAKLSKIPGIDAHTLEKAEQDSENAEQTAIKNGEEVVVAKAATLIVSALKNQEITLPDNFFDDMEIEDNLAVKIQQAIKA